MNRQERTGAMQRAILDYLAAVGAVLLHPAAHSGRPPTYIPALSAWPVADRYLPLPTARTTRVERRAIAGLERKGMVRVDDVVIRRLAWQRLALIGDAPTGEDLT